MYNLEASFKCPGTLRSSMASSHRPPAIRSVMRGGQYQVKTAGIPTDIFRMKDLTIIDFSHNQLREVPPNLEYARGAIVLNLSHNNIENIPNQVFSNLIDLLFLDLSNNKLDMLPPQIRRLTMVQELKLMTSLRVLHMRNTNRTLENIPPSLDDLENLRDIDFAENNLPAIPEALFKLKNLRKLDVSGNKFFFLNVRVVIENLTVLKIEKITIPEGSWEMLETLNISGNGMTSLPDGLVRLTKLQRLYASDNHLTFEGIPSGIGKLVQLIVLHLTRNNLELVPEGITRCVRLQRLRLNHNRLITLPDGIHLLPDLKELDLTE
ncbi:leucine Rich repeat-containing domain protein [Ostertagia ostertagi]